MTLFCYAKPSCMMRIIGGGHAYSILTVSKLLLGIKFDLA
jgi:hypothetical protein